MKTCIAELNLLIVDDSVAQRQFAQQICSDLGLQSVHQAENGIAALKIFQEKKIDVVLIDLEMPVMDGIETVKMANQIYKDVKFLMVTVFDDDEKIFEAIKAGASGYLLKDEPSKVIADAIREVLEFGGVPMSPRVARKAMNLLMNAKLESLPKDAPIDDYQLSNREMDILKLMVDGYDYKIVADKLFISPHTVRKHIANIYEKLHVCSKVDAVKIAMKKGWFGALFI